MKFVGHSIIALCIGAFAAPASAVVIDFGGLPGSNGDPFINPYQEDGYFVLPAVVGEVYQGHLFGNPAPSVVVGSVFGADNGRVAVVAADGTNFRLRSFDFTSFNGRGLVEAIGYLGGAIRYTINFVGNFDAAWQTVAGNDLIINQVAFNLVAGGTSVNLDNIEVTSGVSVIPEPGVWALMIAGFGLVGTMARKRRTLRA